MATILIYNFKCMDKMNKRLQIKGISYIIIFQTQHSYLILSNNSSINFKSFIYMHDLQNLTFFIKQIHIFRFDILQNTIKSMRNSLKINDIAKIQTGL